MFVFIKADTFEECLAAVNMNTLIALLRKLGFSINCKKLWIRPLESLSWAMKLMKSSYRYGKAVSLPASQARFKEAVAIPCWEAKFLC